MKRLILALLLLGVPSTVSAADRDTSSDTWLESQLVTTYTLNPNLNPFEIDAEVKAGVATLSGAVEEEADKQLAENIARSVAGIRDVKNNIAVKDEARVARKSDGSRSFGQTVTDATITTRVKSKLLWNDKTDGLDINVDTMNGTVALKGKADTEEAKKLAERLAETTPGVRSVDNKLVIAADAKASMTTDEKSMQGNTGTDNTGTDASDGKLGAVDLDKAKDSTESALKDTGKQLSDAWVKTKVASTLSFTRGLDASEIDVTAQNGIVTLKGTARDDAEKQLAAELARDVRGVKEVKNDLTVTSKTTS